MKPRQDIIARAKNIFFPHNFYYFDIFKRLCRINIKRGQKIFHLGAGPDTFGINNLAGASYLVSFDIDFGQLSKNSNRHRIVADADSLPFKSGVFDLIVSDSLFEHLKNPSASLNEYHRVSGPLSRVILITPNKFFYISLFNLTSPAFIKKIVARLARLKRKVFPAYYRFNTKKKIESISGKSGYTVEVLHGYIGWSSYFGFFPPVWIFLL